MDFYSINRQPKLSEMMLGLLETDYALQFCKTLPPRGSYISINYTNR